MQSENICEKLVVSSRVFNAIQSFDVKELVKCSAKEIRPILPCLVRMSLVQPAEHSKSCSDARKEILTLLSDIEKVNAIVALLAIDFHSLESDVKKELQIRQKAGVASSEGFLVPPVQSGLALEFERGDSTRRLRLVLSEILTISAQVRDQQKLSVKPSELFDHSVYIEEVCDVICVALAELPAVLNIVDLVETFLHVKYGPEIICWIVANSPDSFPEVCFSLIANGERHEDESATGKVRMQTLQMLCHMNPTFALSVRSKCVELCRMPALTIILSLEFSNLTEGGDEEGDMVAFISGLLLGNDQQVRNWFSLYARTSQKRKWESRTALQLCRDDILRRLRMIVQFAKDKQLPEPYVVKASSLLRLYCALRGIAGIKFQEEEVNLIVKLITCHPPATTTGVRFVSLGLCMLIACPSLISLQDHEKCGVEWVQWLVKEEAYFESACGTTASFGEMLLLMAIHFHSNQLSAICELVCTTLGMKVPIRPNNLTRMKQIFVQDIFTEQVVTSHAVKVPVTVNLNANIPGFLSVHCIHQLLKSRAFSKHKVPIKDWIYSQICNCTAPLHPVLPSLIEVYTNSVLIPSPKASQDHTNSPITEEEIRIVFRNSYIALNKRKSKKDDTNSKENPSLASQLLLLYYLLLYEDIRLTNMGNIIAAGREVKVYSTEFMSKLPIKYLLQEAQKDQQSYTGLFSPLLRLLATHYPQLSLVHDWLDDRISTEQEHSELEPTLHITDDIIKEGFSHIRTRPLETSMMLQKLALAQPSQVWPHAKVFLANFELILDQNVPRYIQELYKEVWLLLNRVLPQELLVMTVEALIPKDIIEDKLVLNQNTIMEDPALVLRCDKRVFRCAPALEITLKVLEGALASSRNYLMRHTQEHPGMDKSGQLGNDTEREELRTSLISAQESACLQILLETCKRMEGDSKERWFDLTLREINCIVCTFLHHVFIADPNMAKMIHFQGYPRELLNVTVPGVPSMHICLDFIPELLSLACLDKQVFAIDLASHLAVRYRVPKSFSVCRLCINTLSTLLGVLSSIDRISLFSPILPSLVRICQAFPTFVEDVTAMLMQLGRICMSQDALVMAMPGHQDFEIELNVNKHLCNEIERTVGLIFQTTVLPVTRY